MIRKALLALTVVSAMALTGCQIYFGPPNDDPDCEPWGCDQPEPPPGTPGGDCNINSDCAAGCYCNPEGWCEEAGFCNGDWECPSGFICDERASCVPGNSEPTWCMVNEECPSGSYCDPWSGQCLPSWSCRDDVECGGGMHCDERGTCVPTLCDDNSDCPDGYCDVAFGQCIPTWACGNDEECGVGMTCDAGRCVPTPCDSNDDCAAGCYCDAPSGTCVETGFCMGDAECFDGMVCEEERQTCVPVPADPATCYGEVFCDAAAPECMEGTTPGIANGCYTGECIPLEKCEQQPPPPAACEELASEDECVARADCTPTYVGVNCTCQGGQPCRCSAEDASCTCERFDYASCVTL
ncbi:MAG TPA: hypothetical protein VNM90_17095 [Haliangium sp.]|nr:hypothetical protein [Haliangium sp.]